jgi:uncharacterized protein (DUF2384 family)
MPRVSKLPSRSQTEQRQTLIQVVERIVRESGSENAIGFQADAWVDWWVQRPLLALGGRTPADTLRTRGGLAIVTRILEQVQSGAYA